MGKVDRMPFVEGEDSEEDEEELQKPVPEEAAAAPPDPVLPTHHPSLPLLSNAVLPNVNTMTPLSVHSDSPAYAEPTTPMQHRLRERNNGFRMSLGRRLEQVLGGVRHDMHVISKGSAGNLESLQDSNYTIRAVNLDMISVCECMEANNIVDGAFSFLSQ